MISDRARSNQSREHRRGWARLLIVTTGIIITQFILYGPCLIGQKLLLPLDMLVVQSAGENVGYDRVTLFDRLLMDPVGQIEPMRRFAVSEVRAGRLPLWDPHNFCGAPFLAANQAGVFSPFHLLDYVWPDPCVLAWGQMLKALVAGIGAYLFFRRAMRCRFIAAMFGAWIWPQSGFLVLWTMWPISATALWLPWVLLAVRQVIHRPRGRWIVGLAVFTCFSLICGHSATGGHLLLGSGFYAIWILIRRRAGIRSVLGIVLGWALGIALAAPQLLPTLDYMRGSLRMTERLQNGPETKPVGLSALPQLIMPWIDGTTRTGWIYLNSDNPLESAIGGYTGLLAVLVMLPFGLADPRKRKDQFFWLALFVIAAAYVLDLPGGVSLNRLPVISSLSGNRFIFVSGFALLAASISGLDAMLGSHVRRSRLLLITPALVLCIAGWCVWRVTLLPDWINVKATQTMRQAQESNADVAVGIGRVVDQLIDRFQTIHFVYGGLCGVAAVFSLLLYLRRSRILILLLGFAAVAEMLVSAYPVNPQSDRALYDWNSPVLKDIAAAEKDDAGRICGVHCLPPMLNEWYGLSDIRGYDAADPKRYIEFLQLMSDPTASLPDPHAISYSFIPRMPSPLADYIGLRYLVFTGKPPQGSTPRFVTLRHYVIENRSALPRATVPRHATIIPADSAQLAALSDPHFDARDNVILETDPNIVMSADVIGNAHIVREVPSRVEIDYTMQSSGLIVLADEWDAGWHAMVNGIEKPVLRANHAFRAVVVPQGSGKLIFTYDPMSFQIGLWVASVALVGCIIVILRSKSHSRRPL